MPSGGKKYDWVPKLAEDEKIGVDAITDEELEGLVEPVDMEIEEVEIEEPGETPEDEEVVEVSIEEEVVDDLDDDLEEAAGDLSTQVDELIGDIEEIKEKLEDVAEEVSDGATDVVDEFDEEVIEDDFEDDLEDDLEEDVAEIEEIADEGALTSITPGEVEEMDEECCEYCGGAKGISSVAGDNRRFTKVAAISKETKNELKTYWVDYLGYDADYVKWMLEDYEK
jgi:hypothetical protein